MPTTNQLIGGARVAPKHRSKSPALRACPQRRGVVVQATVMNPKKPNSGDRKVVRVKLTTGQHVWARVMGEEHNLSEHSVVLLQGGRTPDLPGVRYRVIRGTSKGDASPGDGPSSTNKLRRKKSRSRYGVKATR